VVLAIQSAAVFWAIDRHPDFIETCCHPAVLIIAARFIRALVNAALESSGAEAVLFA
jgi:hypothetical protein